VSKLVSSKYLTAFSDHRFPTKAPDFATPESYVAYLSHYVDRFGLRKHIECQSRVLSVRKASHGGHIVSIRKWSPVGDIASPSGLDSDHESTGTVDEEWHCDAVVVCSGLNVNPNLPHIPGLDLNKVPVA
jgi:dimethylaniline monooxygenase (N-oxide forming)